MYPTLVVDTLWRVRISVVKLLSSEGITLEKISYINVQVKRAKVCNIQHVNFYSIHIFHFSAVLFILPKKNHKFKCQKSYSIKNFSKRKKFL